MRMLITVVLVGTGLLSTLTLPVAAQATQTVPYKEFFDQMHRFYGGKPYDRLALRLSIQPNPAEAKLVLPVTMVVKTSQTEVPLQLSNQNVVDIPYRPDWVQDNATVTINQAADSYSLRAQIGMKVPVGASFTYAEVKAAFDQFNDLIDQQAGVASFLAPSAKTLRVICGVDCVATLEGSKGRRDITADTKGRVNIPNDKAIAKENPVITVSQPISYTVLTTKE